jgi:DNA primase
MIPDSFKQDLLNRVDIVDVVQRYVQLKKGGANYLGLCPFHGEKTPSFTVSPSKQFYHCFGCGVHGNAIGFMMAYGGMGYVDALKDLASSVGMQVPEMQPRTPEEAARRERETDLYGVMEKAMDFYRAQLKGSPRAIEYLKGRGLTGEIAARFRIGYAPDGWQGLKEPFEKYEDKSLVECGLVIQGDEGKRYDRFRDRVMFPILSARGAVIGFGGRVIGDGEPKYLNSPETPLFEKGREVYGLVQARDAIRTAGRVLVVEGYMDVVALAQFGVSYAVATLGTATTPIHITKLLKLADELVFSFDGDAAGRKAAWRALEVSLPLLEDHKPVRFLFLPEEDDPDTYIRKHGKDAFEREIGKAKTLSGFLIDELSRSADLNTNEGRAKFLAAAKPYLQKMGGSQLPTLVAKEIAALARQPDEAPSLLARESSKPQFSRPAPAKPRTAEQFEWGKRVLALVFAKPALALEVDLRLFNQEHEEIAALAEVCNLIKGAGNPENLSDAMLIELTQNSEHRRLIEEAQAVWLSFKFTPDQAEGELRDTMAKLRMGIPDDEKHLSTKVLKGLATPEEQRLFKERYLARRS